MTAREHPSPDEWLDASPLELDLVTEWVAAWNERTGDNAVAGPDLRVRDRSPDLRYPHFTASPITLSPTHAPAWPLSFTCHAMFPDGSEAAAIRVLAGEETLAEHEVIFKVTAAWYDGWTIRPGEMVFTLQWRNRQASRVSGHEGALPEPEHGTRG